MNVTGGARRRESTRLPKSKTSGSKSKGSKSKGTKNKGTKNKVVKNTRPVTLPKTARALSKKSKSFNRLKASRASGTMSLTELQFIAKSRGIPFGGLTKTKLVRKINNYF